MTVAQLMALLDAENAETGAPAAEVATVADWAGLGAMRRR